MARILWIVFAVIIALWLIGLIAKVAGGFIHLLLLVALAILVYNLITGRRALGQARSRRPLIERGGSVDAMSQRPPVSLSRSACRVSSEASSPEPSDSVV